MKLKALTETSFNGQTIKKYTVIDVDVEKIDTYLPAMREQSLLVWGFKDEAEQNAFYKKTEEAENENINILFDHEIIKKLEIQNAELYEDKAKQEAEIKRLEILNQELKKKLEQQPLEKPQLHKQARGYLKTTGRLVGKEMTGQKGLFEIPHFDTAINPYKETLSKMTGITGNLLLSLWQAKKDSRDIYVIDNLTSIANLLDISTQELKLYLIYLAGYQRPISKLEIIKEAGKKDKRILSVYSDKLFYIKFKFKLKDNERESDFLDSQRIGTHYLSFIKDRDVDSVEIMPSASIQEELQGRGLGNVLVDDSFVAFSLDLSDLAYKIFCFSGSNKPHFKIGFDKLISNNYLNIESRVKGRFNKDGKRIRKGQGKARVLSEIKDAFKELLDSGYFTKWNYDEQTYMFSWTYSNKIIKHKDFTRKEPETIKAVIKHKELLKAKAGTLKINAPKPEETAS